MSVLNDIWLKIILLLLFWIGYLALIRWAYIGKHHFFHHVKDEKKPTL